MPVYLAFTSTLIPRPDTFEEVVSAPAYRCVREPAGIADASTARTKSAGFENAVTEGLR